MFDFNKQKNRKGKQNVQFNFNQMANFENENRNFVNRGLKTRGKRHRSII